MTDIVERLRIYATDDHERGCQGRYYDCSCGYDEKRDPLLKEAAAEIERLRAALRRIGKTYPGDAHRLILSQREIINIARAALTAQPAEGEK